VEAALSPEYFCAARSRALTRAHALAAAEVYAAKGLGGAGLAALRSPEPWLAHLDRALFGVGDGGVAPGPTPPAASGGGADMGCWPCDEVVLVVRYVPGAPEYTQDRARNPYLEDRRADLYGCVQPGLH